MAVPRMDLHWFGRLLPLLLLGAATSYYVPGHMVPLHRPARVRNVHMDDSVKVTVKPPKKSSDGAASTDNSGSSGVKITTRVRTPEERAAAQSQAPNAAATPADPADSDKDMSISVTVKKPTAVAAPPPPPGLETVDLSDSEKLLLEGTQKANCTMMLEALQAGANPNVRDPKGRTPLHFVAGLGLAPAAVVLIHFGAQLDVRDGDGLTPIHMSAGYANSQTLRVLVAAGADTTVTAQSQGTPTQVVIALGDYQLGQFINRTGTEKLKKKDDKLEKLKACLDVLDNIEEVREEANWDEMLKEVLQCTNAD